MRSIFFPFGLKVNAQKNSNAIEIKKITYSKKYEYAPFICMLVTGLTTAIVSIASIKFHWSDNLMFIPMVLGACVFFTYLFLLSNNYNHSDLPRHELAINFSTSEIGRVTWVSLGRQDTIVRGEF